MVRFFSSVNRPKLRRLRPKAIGVILVVITAFGLALWTAPTEAQGRDDYFNVESPQVHPIEAVRIDGHDYLIVCNTPNNTVEIWDTDESIPAANRFLASVRTGLEPVTVRYHAELDRFYVANFLGDSVTMFQLSAPSGPASLTATVERTTWVGDEPLDISFYSFDNEEGVRVHTVFITHMTLDAFGWYNALDLSADPSLIYLDATVNSGLDLDADNEIDDIAIKEPHTTLVHCNHLFILGAKGGNTALYDFDLYANDLATGIPRSLGNIGSTNLNMAFASNDDLYVVGLEALNVSLRDEPVVAQAPTGFVKSMFYLVEEACTTTPTVHRRDVNLKPAGETLPGTEKSAEIATTPVDFGEALAMPTDLVPFERQNLPTKVFFTAFSSDRIGVIEPNPAVSPNQWPLRRIDIAPVNQNRAGPRGLALRPRAGRLYVLNRLDNSVTIIDAVNETAIGSFSLTQDPTPSYIRDGQEFLYSADLSGNGFVSCASCHIDARTDGLAWDLGVPLTAEEDIPPLLRDNEGIPESWLPDKEFMVTQTLQGLLNFEVEPEQQDLFTNAPYHWRADRADFTRFNPAFVGLLGRATELTENEMTRYETFINSVQYPGNPKQAIHRVYSGELGDPNSSIEPAEPGGALRGLKLFHIRSSDGSACVHCHALPAGSNTRITESLFNPAAHVSLAVAQAPLETAALRGLFQREARLDRNGSSDHNSRPITGFEGMTHTGLILPVVPTAETPNPVPNAGPDFNQVATINAFNRFFFANRFCGDPDAFCNNVKDVNQYTHEFDWGVSPMIGVPLTITLGNKALQGTIDGFDIGEGQVHLANAGMAVQAWIGDARRGFWYDVTTPTPAYREEPGGAMLSRQQLLDLVTGPNDRLVVMGVPLGSERRIAAPNNQTVPLVGSAPSNLAFLSMVPNTANADVPQLTFFWEDPNPNDPDRNKHGGAFSHTVRLFQYGLVQDGPTGAFGAAIRHEPPRRFRVSGDDIRHGARLEILTHDDPGLPNTQPIPPQTQLRPGVDGQVELRTIVLPLHPTHDPSDPTQIWETSVEMQNILYLRMMLGGPHAPGVGAAFNDQAFNIVEPPATGMFSPTTWNWHWVRVVNEDGTSRNLGWQRLTIQ